MMKKLQLSMVVLSFALLTTSSKCSNTQPSSQAEDSMQMELSQTLAFDSVEYHFSNVDSTLTCDILVDAPQGNDSLSVGIKHFLNEELAYLGLPNVISDTQTPKNVYQGELDAPQRFVDFYGKKGTELLQETLNELRGDRQERAFVNYEASIRKIGETNKYLTFQSYSYAYTGGAHGAAIFHATNIIKPSGKVLTQTVDTTKVNALQGILRKGVVSYLKEHDEAVTEKNVTSYLFVENDIIPLPAVAPYLAKDGVHFVYGQYEIGPYALGAVEFTVPYTEIKPYLTPEALKLIE